MTPFDAGYPRKLRDRLGDQSPPVLFTVGARELLSSEGIGVVGSRAVRPDGAAVAREVAELAAAAGRTVISGGANGVDREAMTAAHGAGGRVVGYLADSLVRRVREPDTRRAIADGTTCLATPFAPQTTFSAANALGRNKLIYASAAMTLVVACDLERGGTWEGAVQALRRGYGSVAAWVGPGAGPGNERLRGARRDRRRRRRRGAAAPVARSRDAPRPRSAAARAVAGIGASCGAPVSSPGDRR